MQNQNGKDKNIANTTTSSTNLGDCDRCGGNGYILEKMLMSTFWERYRKPEPYLYGKMDWEDYFGVPCPKCAGGMERRTSLVKKYAGIPSVFYNKRYNTFDWGIYSDNEAMIDRALNAKEIADSFIEKFEEWEKRKMGLYIWNETKGSGKTLLASCICNELISKYCIGTKFVSASDLLEISQTEYPDEREELKRRPIKLLYSCKLLVIDDLGQKNCGQKWMEDILFKILDERINNDRVTIITSNIPMGKLPFDDRSTDRLFKMCYEVEMPQKSVRASEAYKEKAELLKAVGLVKEN